MPASPARPTLAIIIVSFNTSRHLHRSLQSLRDHAPEWTDRMRVVVVDNASADDSAAMVARDFPAVELLALPLNLGFTGGNNLALRHLGFTGVPLPHLAVGFPESEQAGDPTTTPDYVLLLNPDTEITPHALTTLTDFLENTPHAGVCGPQLRYGDGAFQHGAFTFPDWKQVALDLSPVPILPGIRRLWTRLLHSRLNGRYPARLWQGQTPFAVDFVLGAAMCVRAAAIRQTHGLDDGFFMYCEEMDWCLRMAQAGYGVYAVPAALVVHYEAQSTRQVRRTAYVRLWRSRLRFLHKHAACYTPAHRRLIQTLARLHWHAGKVRTWRDLAHGILTGKQAQAELNAYNELLRL